MINLIKLRQKCRIVFIAAGLEVCLHAQTNPENVIKNGNFENNLEFWTQRARDGNASKAAVDENVIFIDGKKSLRLDIQSDDPSREIDPGKKKKPVISMSYSELIPYVEHGRFKFSLWAKSTAPVELQFVIDGEGWQQKKHWYKTLNAAVHEEWKNYFFIFVFDGPESSKYLAERKNVKLMFSVPGGNAASSSVWIDNIELTPVKQGNNTE
ncbi:MAG: hypothetical protein A2096_06465 [Spirochaetes bacterium GWF1_41_5]|nr:MAG: hypothetical protein A2096_06465 [Spirochaetes bacterium GWF1_41_5]HBE01236.1 hypothetical protein [Spirochaetia bacterium]